MQRRQVEGGDPALRYLRHRARIDDDEEVDAHRPPLQLAQAGDGGLHRRAGNIEAQPVAQLPVQRFSDALFDRSFGRGAGGIATVVAEPAAGTELVLRLHLRHGRQIEFTLSQVARALFGVAFGGDGPAIYCGQAAAYHRILRRVIYANLCQAHRDIGPLFRLDVDDEAVGCIRRRGVAPGRHQVAAHHGQQQQGHQAQGQRHDLHHGGARAALQRGDGKAPALVIDGAAQRLQRGQSQPAGQREHGKRAKEAERGPQRQLHIARLPQQQHHKAEQCQAVSRQRHRPRRILLAAHDPVVRYVAQLQYRRQRETEQQQHAGRHALQRRQQRRRG